MMLLAFASLLGSFITIAAILPYDILVAFALAPFGGSLLAFIAGLLLAFLRARAERTVELTSDAYCCYRITR